MSLICRWFVPILFSATFKTQSRFLSCIEHCGRVVKAARWSGVPARAASPVAGRRSDPSGAVSSG